MQAAANAFQDSMGPIDTVVHPEYKVCLWILSRLMRYLT
jgi:hypothetical protein